MTLADYGFTSAGPIHMRLNGQQSASFSAVCSDTLNNDNNAWHDSAADGHWGNGLEIWLR